MNKLVLLVLACAFIVTLPLTALAKDYRYMSAADVKSNMEKHAAMTLVDIQVEPEFAEHHITNAVATYAYPVKSGEDKQKMAAVTTALLGNNDIAVVVCPRGAGGAKRAYDHLLASGVAEERLYILTDGQAKWPYPELLAPVN